MCLFFANHLIAAEYHEQESADYMKTGLFKSCLCAKYNCMILILKRKTLDH